MRIPVLISLLPILIREVCSIPLIIPDNPKEYQSRRLSLLEKKDNFDEGIINWDRSLHGVKVRDNDIRGENSIERAKDGGIFSYGDKTFYGTGSVTHKKPVERGTSWVNVIEEEGDNVERGFITVEPQSQTPAFDVRNSDVEDFETGFIDVDVVGSDVEPQNQTPAFDVRNDNEIDERGEEGFCATCLKRDSEPKVVEPDKVFVHWSKNVRSGSRELDSSGTHNERSNEGPATIMELQHDWSKRKSDSPKYFHGKRMERANRLPKNDPTRPVMANPDFDNSH